jgi:hypothetical protein
MPRFRFDFRLIEVEAELAALGEYLFALEAQLIYLRDQKRVQTLADLRQTGSEDDDVEIDLAHQELRLLVEHTYPKSFRGTFVVSLWAVYESGISEVADFLRRRIGATETLAELRRGSILRRAERYYKDVLGFPLHPDPGVWASLTELYAVRNAYAHANGRLSAMDAHVRETIDRLIGEQVGVSADLGDILLTEDYIRHVYSLVNAQVRDLVRRARAFASALPKHPSA